MRFLALLLILAALGAPQRVQALGQRTATAGAARRERPARLTEQRGRRRPLPRLARLPRRGWAGRSTLPRVRLLPRPGRSSSTLGDLHRQLRGQPDPGERTLRQRCTERLQRLGRCVIDGARAAGRGLRKVRQIKPGKALRAMGATLKRAGRWSKAHPGKAIGIGLGTAAMFATVFCAAPALSAGVASCLTPMLGQTAAGVVGTAAGGALACGSRSLLVHSTPMVLGVDPFNARQLATDVGMSSTFGFLGFAQAAFLKSIGAGLGLGGLTLFGANLVGLVGYEVGKDYLQNRIRSRVASDPKRFGEIWKSSVLMETATNLHRCIPGLGLETNFGAKILGDIGGTIWWDRIINKRNAGPQTGQQQAVHDALTE